MYVLVQYPVYRNTRLLYCNFVPTILSSSTTRSASTLALVPVWQDDEKQGDRYVTVFTSAYAAEIQDLTLSILD